MGKVAIKWQAKRSRWDVCYYLDRFAKHKFFRTKEEAELHAAELRKVIKSGANPDELATALRLLAGTGHSLATMVEAGLKTVRENGAAKVRPTVTYKEATEIFFRGATQKREVREVTARGYRFSFKVLNETFGNRIVSTITASEVEEYLSQLPNRQGIPGKATRTTKANALRHIRMPLNAVGIPRAFPELTIKYKPQEIRFFDNASVCRILEFARPRERGAIALLLFGSLRPTLASVLPEQCVDPKRRFVTIPAKFSKDGQPHHLEGQQTLRDGRILHGLPDVLWEWLEAYPYQRVPWASVQRRIREAVGHWVPDGLRHTAATNYCALNGLEATAKLLTHQGYALVFKHYAGLTTVAEAEAFYNIKPDQFSRTPVTVSSAPPRKVVQYPPDDVLRRLVWEKPVIQIARELNCSDPAVHRHCKKQGIPTPPVGYWRKVLFGKIVPPAGATIASTLNGGQSSTKSGSSQPSVAA